jgi:hypothetical protein
LKGKVELIEFHRQQLDDFRRQNTDLMGIIRQRAQWSSIEIHKIAQAEITMNETSNKTIHIGDIDNRGGVFNLADLMKDINNSINQLPTSEDPQNPGLKELLIQFQTLILQTSAEELPDEVKKLALEQLKMLAQIGQDPNANKTTVQAILGSLRGFISHLPIAVAAHGLISGMGHLFNLS